MFLYRCFLLWCWLELAYSWLESRFPLRHIGALWGHLGSLGVKLPKNRVARGARWGIWRFSGVGCQKLQLWAVICMGTVLPDKRPLSLEALAQEKPSTLMAQLRAVWPHVERALKAGHTLRLIHKSLNIAGIGISYKRLTVYRGRIQRRNKTRAVIAPSSPPTATALPDGSPPVGFDPLANLREQERKQLDWQYPSGPPDESKLI